MQSKPVQNEETQADKSTTKTDIVDRINQSLGITVFDDEINNLTQEIVNLEAQEQKIRNENIKTDKDVAEIRKFLNSQVTRWKDELTTLEKQQSAMLERESLSYHQIYLLGAKKTLTPAEKTEYQYHMNRVMTIKNDRTKHATAISELKDNISNQPEKISRNERAIFANAGLSIINEIRDNISNLKTKKSDIENAKRDKIDGLSNEEKSLYQIQEDIKNEKYMIMTSKSNLKLGSKSTESLLPKEYLESYIAQHNEIKAAKMQEAEKMLSAFEKNSTIDFFANLDTKVDLCKPLNPTEKAITLENTNGLEQAVENKVVDTPKISLRG